MSGLWDAFSPSFSVASPSSKVETMWISLTRFYTTWVHHQNQHYLVSARHVLKSTCVTCRTRARVPFQQLFPRANPDALDLLDRMLAFDPSQRIGVEEALEHRYLAIWHDASDEPACPTTFDFSFETVEDVQDMRHMILQEVKSFRQLVRNPQQMNFSPQQGQQGQQVPIPEGYDPRTFEDPRPQEMAGRMQGQDLERELQGGLDAMRH